MGGLGGQGTTSTMLPGSPLAFGLSNPLVNNGGNQPPNPGYSQFISHLLKAEPPLTANSFRTTTMRIGPEDAPGGNGGMMQFQDVCVRLLFNHVEWIRRVPYFSTLRLEDQQTLLQSTWPDIFLMNLAQFYPSIPHPQEESLKTGISHRRSTTVDREDASARVGSSQCRCTQEKPSSLRKEDYKRFQENITRIKALQMDPVEYSCIKSLLLFNPDVDQLIDPMTIECIQTKTQAALEEYLHYQFPYQNPSRYGQLMLRLLGIRNLSHEFSSYIMLPPDLQTQKSVDSILSDLFNSHSVIKPDPFTLTPMIIPSPDDRYDTIVTPMISELEKKSAFWSSTFGSLKQESSPDFATHFQAMQRELDPRCAWNLSRTNEIYRKTTSDLGDQLLQLSSGASDPVFNRTHSFSTYYQVLRNHFNTLNSSHPT